MRQKVGFTIISPLFTTCCWKWCLYWISHIIQSVETEGVGNTSCYWEELFIVLSQFRDITARWITEVSLIRDTHKLIKLIKEFSYSRGFSDADQCFFCRCKLKSVFLLFLWAMAIKFFTKQTLLSALYELMNISPTNYCFQNTKSPCPVGSLRQRGSHSRQTLLMVFHLASAGPLNSSKGFFFFTAQ